MVKVVSEKYSLKGWKFSEWFKGNWSTLKELGKVGAPLVLSFLLTNDPKLTGLVTIVGKFLLDVGEYYVKEYTA